MMLSVIFIFIPASSFARYRKTYGIATVAAGLPAAAQNEEVHTTRPLPPTPAGRAACSADTAGSPAAPAAKAGAAGTPAVEADEAAATRAERRLPHVAQTCAMWLPARGRAQSAGRRSQ